MGLLLAEGVQGNDFRAVLGFFAVGCRFGVLRRLGVGTLITRRQVRQALRGLELKTETHGRVGLVTLNRPKAMNALNDQLLNEVMDALETFDKDDNVGAMVITGNEKAFAAGADIKEMVDKTPQDMQDEKRVLVFDRILSVEKPVIAAVSGWALGGGCEIALSCDMIIASESTKFGQPEITIGVIPGAGGDIGRNENVIVLPHGSPFFHPDLVNASDCVVGKLGYSTLAEIYRAGVPFGFVVRRGFRDRRQQSVRLWINAHSWRLI